jgi:hypothetical protein
LARFTEVCKHIRIWLKSDTSEYFSARMASVIRQMFIRKESGSQEDFGE